MELIIKIIAIAILSMIAIGTLLYLISVIVDTVQQASVKYPSPKKSELHYRDRYEVAQNVKSNYSPKK